MFYRLSDFDYQRQVWSCIKLCYQSSPGIILLLFMQHVDCCRNFLTQNNHHQNIPDMIHNLACVYKMLIRIMVGKLLEYNDWDKDLQHRVESEIYNVFPDTWIGAYYNRIETSKTLSLITHSSTGKDGPLSWRLTLDEMRVRSIVYPHNCEVVGSTDCSFWKE